LDPHSQNGDLKKAYGCGKGSGKGIFWTENQKQLQLKAGLRIRICNIFRSWKRIRIEVQIQEL
jgi:hypothetical protein